MARKNATKQVSVSLENAEKLAKLSDQLGLSITQIVDLFISRDLAQLDNGSQQFHLDVRRDDNGKMSVKLL